MNLLIRYYCIMGQTTNDLRSEKPAEKIASNKINVAVSAKNKKTLFMFQD